MFQDPHNLIALMIGYVLFIITGSVLYYVKDIVMEKINDRRMEREEIEEEKEQLRVEIKEIENTA